LALFCAEWAPGAGLLYRMIFDDRKYVQAIELLEKERETARALIKQFGPQAERLFPSLVNRRTQRGPFQFKNLLRPSAHVTSVDLALQLIHAAEAEHIRGGTVMRPPNEVPIVEFSDLPALVHEIVFEAAGVATGPPSGNMSPEPPAYSPSESEEKVLLYLLEMYPRRKKQDDI